jgi:hypothetical protein
MRKIYLSVSLFATFSIIMVSGLFQESQTNSNGSFFINPSSAPGQTTCAQSGCHGGTLNGGPGSVQISTNIPQDGYIPNETYTITVNINSGGSNGVRYGFAASATNSANQQIGGFAVINNNTQLRLNGQVVSHTSAGNSGGTSSKQFVFNWTAPAAGVGNVTFYTSGMSANGNGTTSGDQVYTNNLTISENLSASVAEKSFNEKFGVYPNPAKSFVNVDLKLNFSPQQVKYRIIDLTGKTMVSSNIQYSENFRIEFPESIKSGIYLVEVEVGDKIFRKKVLTER